MEKPASIIYFDHNAALDIMQGRNLELSEAVRRAKEADSRFVYSPAHIEEIAVILRQEELSDESCAKHVYEHIRFYSDFTNDWEFLPSQGEEPTVLTQEHPSVCYDRVIQGYELTYFAEGVSGALREFVKATRPNPTPIDAFERKEVARIFSFRRGIFVDGGEPPLGPALRRTHKLAERWIDMALRSLEEAGFDLETAAKNRN